MRYWLVMPAAGAGRRFGGDLPKQYASLRERTVIEWSLAPFTSDPRCAGIAVAIAADDHRWPRIAERLPAVVVAPGGGHRSESVRSGLATLSRRADPQDWVLVHDAARPCLSSADRDRLIEVAGRHETGGLLAVPAADTLKKAGPAGSVCETIDRSALWRALTPQMFRFGALSAALDAAHGAGRFPTDEAQALEWAGGQPLLVEGSAANIKVTRSEDLLLADALLGARSEA